MVHFITCTSSRPDNLQILITTTIGFAAFKFYEVRMANVYEVRAIPEQLITLKIKSGL
ncbi:hypothetical protein NTE_00710 [Candidatus Nitrososphaera evergladensis SR1]|uniref:Uncharacterized protein n=1 Tax=Candidatus Nitrososphaera evergladensis SR1 TaxID=1459636 RepID=A0A075MNT2_9ARCH|nr:hypothetical protein NTE_00710 [Candidatus Nitrososphaera evergladensis SR1]